MGERSKRAGYKFGYYVVGPIVIVLLLWGLLTIVAGVVLAIAEAAW